MRYYLRQRGEDQIRGPFTPDQLASQVTAGNIPQIPYLVLPDSGQTQQELLKHWNQKWIPITDVKGLENLFTKPAELALPGKPEPSTPSYAGQSRSTPSQPVIRKRPTGVTIVCWTLIVTSALTLLETLVALASPDYDTLLAKNHLPVALQKVLGFVGPLITLLSGALILNGAGWARWVFIGWGAFMIPVTIGNLGFTPLLLGSLPLYGLFTAVLLQKSSADYFRRDQ